jgi:hypothetical protein
MERNLMDYIKPEVVDYGTVEELTAQQSPATGEDGGNKVFHGSSPLI